MHIDFPGYLGKTALELVERLPDVWFGGSNRLPPTRKRRNRPSTVCPILFRQARGAALRPAVHSQGNAPSLAQGCVTQLKAESKRDLIVRLCARHHGTRKNWKEEETWLGLNTIHPKPLPEMRITNVTITLGRFG